MLKPRHFLLAAVVTLALSACITAPEPTVSAVDSNGIEIPAWLDLAGTGHPARDLTWVGETDLLVALSSRNNADEWCVVLALKPAEGDPGVTTGSSCVSPAKFADQGVGIRIGNETVSGNARIFPDGYTGPIEEGWVRVNDNLAVRE
ncbi:hypothetical protein [Salinibacterium sp. SWN167]|uniref:hypothetical protein n=1 Tax=Salinibacterium sp. SWN167 TaxID=2792054 RepID=UPI0018CD0C48|nr:hypothetical protein [Salinibacterium sp. SWN167]MBH0083886.1 hypothetical protein [Salinibacterium sp. SWN167]